MSATGHWIVFAPNFRWTNIGRDRDGRSVPRHVPLQCTHDGKRRTLGRVASIDLHGGSFVSLVAGSLRHAAGLPELVTQDLGAYEARPWKLAHAPDRLTALRAKLSRNRDNCALFDTDRLRPY